MWFKEIDTYSVKKETAIGEILEENWLDCDTEIFFRTFYLPVNNITDKWSETDIKNFLAVPEFLYGQSEKYQQSNLGISKRKKDGQEVFVCTIAISDG